MAMYMLMAKYSPAALKGIVEGGSDREAAARAASVAPDTAIPQSAFLSAGASFTPSPVMPTM